MIVYKNTNFLICYYQVAKRQGRRKEDRGFIQLGNCKKIRLLLTKSDGKPTSFKIQGVFHQENYQLSDLSITA